MDILGFVNSNGTLCTILGSIITALISAIVAIVIDNRKSKVDSVRTLKKELAEAKLGLEDARQKLVKVQAVVDNYRSIEKEESSIDKSTGAIYVETLLNGSKRNICGYCWEKERVKLPIVVDLCYDEYEKRRYYRGICEVCNASCIENISPTQYIRTIGDSANTANII